MTDKNDTPSNYFLVHRGWRDSNLFSRDEPKCREAAWIYLIENASWKPRQYVVGNTVIDLERGQLTASLRFLATSWKWSKNKVDLFLKTGQKLGMLRVEKRTGQNVITICNYSKYQIDVNSSGTDRGQIGDRSGTISGQIGDKTKKDNKDKKVNKENKIEGAKRFAPPTISECEDYFFKEKEVQDYSMPSQFWNYYESNGWKVGNNKMVSWKRAASGWISRQPKFNKPSHNRKTNQNTGNIFSMMNDHIKKTGVKNESNN